MVAIYHSDMRCATVAQYDGVIVGECADCMPEEVLEAWRRETLQISKEELIRYVEGKKAQS